MMKKAAVVIGVDKTGNLTPLTSAAAGAERVSEWLQAEGFDVTCLTDKAGPVTCAEVEQAIERFVTLPPRFHLLVVYFSGHGYWQARSDTWLLSNAPRRPNEAINLDAAIDLARYSGIRNVVFVSDACRSIPDSRSGARVQGSGAFPNYDEITTVSKIDYFKATSDARPAYEGKVDGIPQSVLTTALMSAYVDPDAHMVRQITEGRETLEVVPNRRLEDYLQRKVDDLLASIDPNAQQQIEINVPSSEDVYIARVRRVAAAPPPVSSPARPAAPPASAPPPPAPPPPAAPRASTPAPPAPPTRTVPGTAPRRRAEGRQAAAAVAGSLSTNRYGTAGVDAALARGDAALESKLQKRLPDASIDHYETQTGFVIHGPAVVRAVASRGPREVRAQLLTPGDGNKPGLIRLESAQAPVVQREEFVSVGVQLQDGRAVVLAGLPGYIGHVVFKQEGMAHISYLPSGLRIPSNDEARRRDRFEQYQQRRDEIDRLRAMVALAVDRQTFRLTSDQQANAFAERIRISKSIDPTLGLYAAYAFAQAGNDQEVVSVLSHMREDLGTDLFDVHLLANRHRWVREGGTPVTPFCPMLTQGWSLLQPRNVTLHPVLQDASAVLCSSLWTTFEPGAATAILDAMETGDLR